MGDRSRFAAVVRRDDVVRFTGCMLETSTEGMTVGDALREWEEDVDLGNGTFLLTESMMNEGGYYGISDAADMGIPFCAQHGRGVDYDAFAYVGFQGELYLTPVDIEGYPFVRCFEGGVSQEDISIIKEYWAALRNLCKAHGCCWERTKFSSVSRVDHDHETGGNVDWTGLCEKTEETDRC